MPHFSLRNFITFYNKKISQTMKHILRVLFLFVFVIVDYGFLNKDISETPYNTMSSGDPFKGGDEQWVDSVYNSMTLDEKIGQLFMVAAYSTDAQSNKKQIAELIEKYAIGGVIFMQGHPTNQVQYTNYFQSLSKVPLFIAIDGEWGLAMRLDSTQSFPKQLMLGAIPDNKLIYQMGYEIGRQCNRMGIHINFAPVVDVNNNPNNPVINYRSFGENPYAVAIKGDYYMSGMQDRKIITTAKHFPGHGDTDTDSHADMPIILHSKARLDSVELYPFKYLIQRNLTGIMVAHLHLPQLDKRRRTPATLSQKIVQETLKDELGFKGLVFTDALNMKGVTKHNKPGRLEMRALLAGNDVLLFPENVPVAVEYIKQAIQDKKLNEKIIEEKCKKILLAKSWAGITDSTSHISTENLMQDLHSPQGKKLIKELTRAAITVVKDDYKQLPIAYSPKNKLAYVSFSNAVQDTFLISMQNFTDVAQFYISPRSNFHNQLEKLTVELQNYSAVIINVEGSTQLPYKQFGIPSAIPHIVHQIAKMNNVILVLHANPYSLELFKSAIPEVQSIVVAYDNDQNIQYETPQIIFGAYPAQGLLPVAAAQFKAGTGIQYRALDILKHGLPEEVGMNSSELQNIDSIMQQSIAAKAFPGGQILVAKQGVIVYRKNFGTLNYKSNQKVQHQTIYDLASVTKPLATTISLMKLYEQGKFSLDSTLGAYIPQAKHTNKDTITMKNILTHQAQLQAWIPFYQYMIKDFFNPNAKDLKQKKRSKTHPIKVNEYVYLHKNFMFIDSSLSPTKTDLYSMQIAQNVYMNPEKKSIVYNAIYDSKLAQKKEVVYSDLGFILLAQVINTITDTTIDVYAHNNFYKPLGAQTVCFNPLSTYQLGRIAPTEHDEVFRQQLIQGYVHDPAAAMLGGVSGHAGLFGNTTDLAKVLQMLVQKGYYGGIRYLQPETIELFTSCPYCSEGNRKGYGFDKPEIDSTKIDPTCRCTSSLSYGHTGFTGTMFWIDPAQELVYIFLSNRVCPDADNVAISNLKIRPRIQQIIYNSLYKYD